MIRLRGEAYRIIQSSINWSINLHKINVYSPHLTPGTLLEMGVHKALSNVLIYLRIYYIIYLWKV